MGSTRYIRYLGAKLWSKLDAGVKSSATLEIFKSNCTLMSNWVCLFMVFIEGTNFGPKSSNSAVPLGRSVDGANNGVFLVNGNGRDTFRGGQKHGVLKALQGSTPRTNA